MHSLHKLFVDEMQDLYDAEHQVSEALPKMADHASTAELADGFRQHLEETRGQIDRLEKAFRSIGEAPERKHCKGMAGLVKEGEDVMQEEGDPAVKDAALIAAAQRVEHYEMAAYGTLVAMANVMNHREAADLLQESLNEEKATDLRLTQIASKVNAQAAEGKAVSGGQATMVAPMAPPHTFQAESGSTQIWVSPRADGGWAVHRAKSDDPLHVTDTQAEAIELGREAARRLSGELVIQGKDGQIREKRSYGTDPQDAEG